MKQGRLQSVDALKGIAMLMVILVHYNQTFAHNVRLFQFGQMGCQFFFVLSGLVVSRSYRKKMNQQGFSNSLRPFWIARWRSIAPAYCFMIFVVLLVNLIFIAQTGSGMVFGTNRHPAAILANVLLLHGLLPFANNSVMPGGWYIGTTALLYLITPFIVKLFCGWRRDKRLLCGILSAASVGGVLLAAWIFPQWEHLILQNNSFGYYFVCTQFPCYCLGILLGFSDEREPISPKKAGCFLLLGLCLLAGSIVLFFHPVLWGSFPVTVSAVGLSAYYLTRALMSFEQRRPLSRLLRPLIKLGNLSLYVYLVHAFFAYTFVLEFKKLLAQKGIAADSYLWFWLLLPIVICLSYGTARLLQRLVDRMVAGVERLLSTLKQGEKTP